MAPPLLLAEDRVWLRVTRPDDESDADEASGEADDGPAAALLGPAAFALLGPAAAAALLGPAAALLGPAALLLGPAGEMRRDDRSGISRSVRSFWRLRTVW